MSTPPLFAASYSSVPAQPLTGGEVDALVSRAAAKNRKAGVTGQLMLVEDEGLIVRYVQWIEGPRDALLDLVVGITNDPRHYDVRLSHLAPAVERRYPDWSMRERRVSREILDKARLWTPTASHVPVKDAVFDILD